MKCNICGRLLDNETDPLSGDSGGDCNYCMLLVESDGGDYRTAIEIAEQITERLSTMASKLTTFDLLSGVTIQVVEADPVENPNAIVRIWAAGRDRQEEPNLEVQLSNDGLLWQMLGTWPDMYDRRPGRFT